MTRTITLGFGRLSFSCLVLFLTGVSFGFWSSHCFLVSPVECLQRIIALVIKRHRSFRWPSVDLYLVRILGADDCWNTFFCVIVIGIKDILSRGASENLHSMRSWQKQFPIKLHTNARFINVSIWRQARTGTNLLNCSGSYRMRLVDSANEHVGGSGQAGLRISIWNVPWSSGPSSSILILTLVISPNDCHARP